MRKNLSARSTRAPFESIDHRGKAYALAATAAGVSLLALAQTAEAEVVVTKKNIPIPVGHPVSLDLNKDGNADFEFELSTTTRNAYLSVLPLTGGKAVGNPAYQFEFPYASALVHGAKIGPSAHFSSNKGRICIERTAAAYANTSLYYPREIYGKWGYNPVNRYLGVRFSIKGATHYGWIRITVTTEPAQKRLSATITAYAYETVPRKVISAGSSTSAATVGAENNLQQRAIPAHPSLGMLASGADGLSLWRKE